MNQHTALSRRSFVVGGGSLFVYFALPKTQAAAEIARGSFPPYVVGPSAENTELDSWMVINDDNTATFNFGRTEFGQGTLTGMLQIAAEELDLDMNQVSAANLDTAVTRDQGMQVSSSSIEGAAPSLRAAAAEARQALMAMAAERLKVSPSSLRVSAGIVTTVERSGPSISYGDLVKGTKFSIKVTGTAPLKPVADYKLVGTPAARVDTPAKMKGTYEYLQHIRVPNMLHGRVVRPAGQGALAADLKVKSIDKASIADLNGVQVVQTGSFIGVVAEDEWIAVKAATQLKVEWDIPAALAGCSHNHDKMRAAKTDDRTLVDTGDVDKAIAQGLHSVSWTFKGPYESHAPFAPNCALADVRADSADVYCATQSLFALRGSLARCLKMKPEQVRVRYFESSGTFGHSCYNDVAQAAALLSQAVGKPVRVQFSRANELGWDNYGPAHLADIRAAADANGQIVAFEYQGWQHGWNFTIESTERLAFDAKIERPQPSPASQVNKQTAGGVYDIPNWRVVSHNVNALEGYLKGSFLRSPLDISISFGTEQVIDELAYRTKIDPIEFRRRNISNPRWLGVLEAVRTASKWSPHVAAEKKSGDIVRGVGVGIGTHFSSYGAAVAEVEVNKKSGVVRVISLVGALDPGLAINPASVEQQIESQLIHAASRMLHEEVTFDEKGVTSLDWERYPILRFEEAPLVTPVVVSRPDQPSTGAGEETMAAAAAAIANAFFDATGVRMHERPMRPERVLAALRAG